MSAKNPGLPIWCDNFAAGYLDTPEADRIPPGATPDAKNYIFGTIDPFALGGERRASMRKRPGSRLLNPTAIAVNQAVDLFEFKRSPVFGAGELLAVCNGNLSKFDTINAFTPIGGGWTPGRTARALVRKDRAYIFDGTFMRRYNGTVLDEVGSGPPTGITNMAAAAGPGPTGTYQAVYTWYEASTDHHSSISAPTANLALVNQQRTHTRPSSPAPSWATHWGIWVRRVDTFEFNYFFCANAPIASPTHTEAISDTNRNTPAAGPGENDPPPGAFALLNEWKGWGIGVLPDSDDYYVSRRGDLQSWHPKNKFPIAKGNGELLTAVAKYGTNVLLLKPHSTHRLVGTTVPFEPEELHDSYGQVTQEAGVEVDKRFYSWDSIRGPYVTDLVSWTPLADGRIRNFVDLVNLQALTTIRAVHVERLNLILWAISLGTASRNHVLLPYHYLLDTWLPPMTGLEYHALTAWKSPAGQLGVYTGDEWGRVYELFSGAHDGASFTVDATSATAGTITAIGAGFTTTGDGLAGMPVAVKSPAGVWQWRRIRSNTADTLVIDTLFGSPFSPVPMPSPGQPWEIVVGGIEWFHWTPWFDFGLWWMRKALRYLYLGAKSSSTNNAIETLLRFNNDEGVTQGQSFSFPTGTLSAIWGVSLWGVGLWGALVRTLRKGRIFRDVFTAQVRFSNFYPDQEVEVTTYGLSADARSKQQVTGPEAP